MSGAVSGDVSGAVSVYSEMGINQLIINSDDVSRAVSVSGMDINQVMNTSDDVLTAVSVYFVL